MDPRLNYKQTKPTNITQMSNFLLRKEMNPLTKVLVLLENVFGFLKYSTVLCTCKHIYNCLTGTLSNDLFRQYRMHFMIKSFIP